MNDFYDVIVIGGGPAGLAAAVSAAENGANKVLILERNPDLGGILNQCIHSGFGLHYFKQELTGPEYAELFIEKAVAAKIEIICGAMVLEIEKSASLSTVTENSFENMPPATQGTDIFAGAHCVHAVSPKHGYKTLLANAVILAMGCRERTRGAIGIAGSRPAGVFTAGAAQLYMNIEGYNIGKKAVILGSGDIGLIMARRLTLEGAKVLGVYELMPYSNGLARNKVQCLDDYDIPLFLSHTITEIHGKKRVEGVTVAPVDKNLRPVTEKSFYVECDTVLLSVGLIPENELSRKAGIEIDPRTNGPVVYENMESSAKGIFACGNVVHVHDLVDFVTAESQKAGKFAAEYCNKCSILQQNQENLNSSNSEDIICLENKNGIGYTVPQKIRRQELEKISPLDIYMRARQVYKNAKILIKDEKEIIAEIKRPFFAPGEMIKVTLTQEIVDKIINNNSKIISFEIAE